jgi:hypothetical protein
MIVLIFNISDKEARRDTHPLYRQPHKVTLETPQETQTQQHDPKKRKK